MHATGRERRGHSIRGIEGIDRFPRVGLHDVSVATCQACRGESLGRPPTPTESSVVAVSAERSRPSTERATSAAAARVLTGLMRDADAHEDPEGPKTVAPGDLLTFLEGPAVVSDR